MIELLTKWCPFYW